MIFSEKILEETLLNPLFHQKYLKFPEYSGNNGRKYAQSGLRTVKDFSERKMNAVFARTQKWRALAHNFWSQRA